MKFTTNILFIFALVIIDQTSSQLTFQNPIYDELSADPCILRLGDFYYLTLSENGETELTIFKSPILTSFRDVEKKIAYVAPPSYFALWASEMHLINGELYIYFTMDGGPHPDHRMYVLKADDPTDPMGGWSDAIEMMTDWDYGAIDGTPLLHGNGQLYFVWATQGFIELWIAPMSDPVTVTDQKMRLRSATAPWECIGYCCNEGAYFIHNKNVSYMIFSAGSTWGPDYALGMSSIHADKDPMNLDNWASYMGPVFNRNDEESVYTTGHAAFTTSPDGTETWMVYHGTVNTTHIGRFRIARIEKIDWNADGSPRFPRPHGYDTPQPVPSGQTYV